MSSTVSTTRPMLRWPSLCTTTSRTSLGSAAGAARSGSRLSRRTSGRTSPRTCTTSSTPTCSTRAIGIFSRRATAASGSATWPSPAVLQMTSASSTALAEDAGALGDAVHVEDERDRAVAEDGGAGVGGDAAELGRDRLDDDVGGVVDVVDHQSEEPVVGGEDDDVELAGVGGRGGPEDLAEEDEGQELPAEPIDRRAVDPLDGGAGGAEVHDLEQADLRDRVALLAGADDDRRHDGERERDLDAEERPGAAAALDVDEAADALDVGLDDVHADAASRDVGDRGRRRETGQEDEADQLALAHALGELGGDEAAGDRLGADLLAVDAVAVVGDLDVDLAAGVEGADAERALGGLAGGDPRLGRLDAVVDGVPDEVREGILDRFEERAVELGLLALELDADLLAAGEREVAHVARQLGEDVADRLHARLHHAFLEVGGDEVQALRGGEEGGGALRARVLDDLVAGEDELT